ncbi:STAS domain-containing protein [Rhodococcus sp. YH1]|uniref:STAS domain-containing protein n=1 Tax=Rhodococcus sp. YH1 TaxID=89066 RepID=UPI00138671F5|nr:hypothetical protein [Rhodococcus sp. YH1]
MVLLYSHTDAGVRVPVVDFVVPERTRFEIAIDRRGAGPVVIGVCGDVDLVTAPSLDFVLRQHFPEHGVVVDLLRVEFLGCAGLTVLESAACGGGRDGPVIAAVAVGEVRHALRVAGVDRMLPCCAEVGRALELVGRSGRAAFGRGAVVRARRQMLSRNSAPG